MLGVPLARGRAFLPEEETPGRNAPVAIVSYSYWQKHDRDPGVVGSQILVNGRPFTIVGITPKGFVGTMQILAPEVWLPISVYDQVANDFGSKTRPPWTIAMARSCDHRAAQTRCDDGHGQACA